ncbi:secreted RxLR effector protein 78-like [Magnolia sinica]|uniref:secreted RxLR effector protein 78-like n=1 Tax=Magnolia sinica TaxID=86752 RepID=UPI002658392D|nr:secreted RxLR effector protein 78-like [Magnolia sinica]
MAFVQGRSIADNISLVQELFRDIDKKVRGSNTVFKIDLEKAYDKVSWLFPKEVLQKFGFCKEWISLAEKCWSGSWFSVLLNGESSGFFKFERGLRQGDPLSPSLFILMMESLDRGLKLCLKPIFVSPFTRAEDASRLPTCSSRTIRRFSLM